MRWLTLAFALTGCSLIVSGNDSEDGSGDVDGATAPDGSDLDATGSDASDNDGATGEFTPLCAASGTIVAHYRFDGDLGTATDSAGTHTGSIAGTQPMSVDSPFGRAARFRRSPSGYYIVPDDNAPDLAQGSIEIWAMWELDGENQAVLARDAQQLPPANDGHLYIRRSSDNRVSARVQDPVQEKEITSSGTVPKDEWVHVVYNWTGSLVELYVDGDLVQQTASTFSWSASPNPLVLGTDQGNAPPGSGTGSPNDYVEGRLDEVVLCDAPVALP